MITEVTAYKLDCDRCGVGFQYEDFTIFTEEWPLDETATDNDWRLIGGRWLCPKCWTFSGEETEDGDSIIVQVAAWHRAAASSGRAADTEEGAG